MLLPKESQDAAVSGNKITAQIVQIAKQNAKENAILKSKPFAFERMRHTVKKEMTETNRTSINTKPVWVHDT